MENIVKEIEDEIELLNTKEETDIEEVKIKPKRKGQSRERMMELHAIRSQKAKERRELKAKEKEVEQIKNEQKKEKINFEYEEAQKLKEALEAKKQKKPEEVIKYEKEKEVKQIYKSVSRDILKEKYIEEAKRRVMMDLFS